jgi:hypothetical protein
MLRYSKLVSSQIIILGVKLETRVMEISDEAKNTLSYFAVTSLTAEVRVITWARPSLWGKVSNVQMNDRHDNNNNCLLS